MIRRYKNITTLVLKQQKIHAMPSRRRFIKNVSATSVDVYDAATWSAITPLSETSVELGNATVEFPNFKSGQWMYKKNKFAATDEY